MKRATLFFIIIPVLVGGFLHFWYHCQQL